MLSDIIDHLKSTAVKSMCSNIESKTKLFWEIKNLNFLSSFILILNFNDIRT